MTLSRILPPVNGQFGAPMGRSDRDQSEQPLQILRMSMDPQGYDAGGAYFGLGDDLWVAVSEDLDTRVIARAKTRADAISVMQDSGLDVGRIQPDVIDPANVDPGAMPAMLSSFLEAGIFMQHQDYLERELDGEYDIDQMVPPSVADLTPEILSQAATVCRDFLIRLDGWEKQALGINGYDETQMGYDLWMERTGSGVGFADRQLSDDVAEELANRAQSGEIDLFDRPEPDNLTIDF
jgi:hypothetical protein